MPTIKHKIVGNVSFENLGGGALRLLNDWEAQNIVTVNIPQLVGVDVGGGKKFSGNVRWFKGGIYQLKKAFEEVEAKGLKPRILTYAGSFVPRMIRGSVRTPSEHTFGTAFDINVAWNGLGQTPAPKGRTGSVVELVPIFEKWGFRWGGNFTRRDGMHMEIARLIRESDAMAKPQTLPPVPALCVLDGVPHPVLMDDSDRPYIQVASLVASQNRVIVATNNKMEEERRFYVNTKAREKR